MFRSIIYLDVDKLYTYKRQLEGKNNPQPKKMSKKKLTGFSAGLNGSGIKGEFETNIESEFDYDVEFDYDQFELALQNYEGEEYFDCVVNDYDLTIVPQMKLFRLCNGFYVPEAFDNVDILDKFKTLLTGSIQTDNSAENEALENIIGNAKTDIPIVSEYDDMSISGKLHKHFLREDYASLEEYDDQDVYMLCKVVGIARGDSVVIFDPLKDFIKLPRTFRRQIERGNNDIGLEKIMVEGPVLKVEIIAIYK